MAKAKILIVDREKILVDLLTRSLSSPELSVFGATTAEQAARLLDLHGPELVVIDLTIPNGLVFVSAAKAPPFKAKVIGVTEEGQDISAVGLERSVNRSGGLDALIAAIRQSLDANLGAFDQQDGVHVLVVDDEEEIRTVLSEYLKSHNYRVATAQNGREALERVQADSTLQIVLLDVSMPQMGGMEALSLIMSGDPHPNVIMMTAVADREVARQAMKIGAFDYILKPFNFAAIEASITACMSYAEYQKQPWWKRLTRR